ncbi:unnamed protein product, partial [Meganyctiphanes norvegica]
MNRLAHESGNTNQRNLVTAQTIRYPMRNIPFYALNAAGPQVPTYPPLNVSLKGYDFTVLEHYGKWVHNTALNMDIDVEDGWATPCKKLKIQNLRPGTSKMETEYMLNVYERNIKVLDLTSTLAGTFIEVIQAGLPEGVELSLREHTQLDTEIRYIPDLELKDLKSQLEELGGPSKKC